MSQRYYTEVRIFQDKDPAVLQQKIEIFLETIPNIPISINQSQSTGTGFNAGDIIITISIFYNVYR